MRISVLVALLVAVSLLFTGIAFALSAYWIGPTKYTDGTDIEPGVLDVMKYYIRTDEPNGVSSAPDATGKYYLATVPPRTEQWPSDGNLEGFFQSRGMDNQVLTFSVSASYVDANGKELEGAPSAGYAWTVPFVPGKTPAQTTGVGVR